MFLRSVRFVLYFPLEFYTLHFSLRKLVRAVGVIAAPFTGGASLAFTAAAQAGIDAKKAQAAAEAENTRVLAAQKAMADQQNSAALSLAQATTPPPQISPGVPAQAVIAVPGAGPLSGQTIMLIGAALVAA